MCENNGNTFIATLHNVFLAPDLCDILFSIIALMNLVHNCLFHKGFYTVYLGDKKKNAMTMPNSAHRKHDFLVKTKEKAKSKKVEPKRKVDLELLHHRLGLRSTRLLMDKDIANVWQDIELRIYPYLFFTSYHIY